VAARAPEALHNTRRRSLLLLLASLLGISAAACLSVQPKVGTVPPTVGSLEGYASWKLVREGASSRTRFSFLFVLPDRGVIEMTDPLNRTLSRLIVEGETAYLVVPRKHAYWQAARSEVMTRLLGFDIRPEELAALLSGRERGLNEWSLETDDQGRLIRGRRGGLTFSVREFFDRGGLPRTVAFANGTDQGSLKIIRLQFNQPPREGALGLAFLDDERYRAVGWQEIEKWLRNED
jgi:outer membrane biogenesis lipoprotein LolB